MGIGRKVRKLLDEGANVLATSVYDYCCYYGTTPLLFASRFGFTAVAQLLIDKGVPVDATDEDGTTPLIDAAHFGRTAVVQLLIDKGAFVDATDEKEDTALHWATRNGYADIVQLLTEHGADVEAADDQNCTALLTAAKKGHEDVVQLLIEHGASVEAADVHGTTPLIAAAEFRFTAVAQLLIDKGASVDATDEDGDTALDRAAVFGHADIVQVLIEHGASVTAISEDGHTPFSLAVKELQDVFNRDYCCDLTATCLLLLRAMATRGVPAARVRADPLLADGVWQDLQANAEFDTIPGGRGWEGMLLRVGSLRGAFAIARCQASLSLESSKQLDEVVGSAGLKRRYSSLNKA